MRIEVENPMQHFMSMGTQHEYHEDTGRQKTVWMCPGWSNFVDQGVELGLRVIASDITALVVSI